MSHELNLAEGDRVRARHRQSFPDGTVLRVLERGFVLIRWDTNVLETSHESELLKIPDELR